MNKLLKESFKVKIENINRRIKNLTEERLRLSEMSNCRPDKTGLPVNIWIDESETYKDGRHSKRIKFQINRNARFDKNSTCPMTLDGNIPKKVWDRVKRNSEFSLSSSDIGIIKNFVVNNAYALDKLADQLLWLDEFWTIVIKGGEEATDGEIQELKDKTDEYMLKHTRKEIYKS